MTSDPSHLLETNEVRLIEAEASALIRAALMILPISFDIRSIFEIIPTFSQPLGEWCTAKAREDAAWTHPRIHDIFVIGGGINGCGIARDAVGRGYSVVAGRDERPRLSGTSSWSTKLIHGGLRYLEHYEFRLVREALMEREVLWAAAPHIIWPMRFVLPHHPACARPGCCGSACSSTTTSAAASCCRRRGRWT